MKKIPWGRKRCDMLQVEDESAVASPLRLRWSPLSCDLIHYTSPDNLRMLFIFYLKEFTILTLIELKKNNSNIN